MVRKTIEHIPTDFSTMLRDEMLQYFFYFIQKQKVGLLGVPMIVTVGYYH